MNRSAIILPRPLQRNLDDAVKNFLFPPSAPAVDFSKPFGEPALMPPDSVSWQVFKNPVALFIGGVAAVILEFGHPSVRSGVWGHTSFRTEPRARMQRTGLAAMMTVYGPRSRTERMIGEVKKLHGHVKGTTPAGKAYRADDPELLTWVHATASFGFLHAYHAYVSSLTPDEHDRFYAEGECSSRLYGATHAPASADANAALFERMQPTLEASPIIFEFLSIMRRAPVLPRPFALIQRLLVKAAVDIVPDVIRAQLGLTEAYGLRPWQRTLVRHIGHLADRLVITSSPAVQSCRRLGLPDDYLYAGRKK